MEKVYSFFELGGPVVVLLCIVSVAALAVILAKIFQFSWRRVGFRSRAELAISLWHSDRRREALDHIRPGKSLSAVVVAEAMQLKMLGHERGPIEERLTRIVTERLHSLQSGFKFLDVVASTAPLLGLFGTVLGMIEAFRELQSAGSAVDPSILAGGIWVALLTTAVGLAVAMPVSLSLTWLESRLEHERVNIETLASDILSEVSPGAAEGIGSSEQPSRKAVPGELARAV